MKKHDSTMRFALRNKNKLIEAFDEDYYNLLIESLTRYFESHDDIQTYSYSIKCKNYQFIEVPNAQPYTDSYFQFAIIKQQYDVFTLAYYSSFG